MPIKVKRRLAKKALKRRSRGVLPAVQHITVSVIGGSIIDGKVDRLAHNVGKTVAKVGAILVCGGLKGAMEAASRGAKEAGGQTVGILPGKEKSDANPFIDIALPTTIGFARNVIVAACSHIVVALPGSHGTSCEISYALVYKRPIVDIGSWNRPGMIKVKNIGDLEKTLRRLIREIRQSGLQTPNAVAEKAD